MNAPDLFSLPDDHVVTREEAAAMLTAAGLAMTPINLAQLHHRGKGPHAIPPDRTTRHTVKDLRDWFAVQTPQRRRRRVAPPPAGGAA